VALDPNCDPCVSLICTGDAFCCDPNIGQWDSLCVSEVTSICGESCP
jgi:hypothetical protein